MEHGKWSMYSRGCRCDSCRDAWNIYCRTNYRKRRGIGWIHEMHALVSKLLDDIDSQNVLFVKVHLEEMKNVMYRVQEEIPQKLSD